MLSTYLFFLLRRPISASNVHYLEQRLRGFRSLSPLFEAAEMEQFHAIGKALRRIEPCNFARTARDLQFRLVAPGAGVRTPPDFIVSAERPRASPFAGARKAVIVTGPAIGIGDEIILFPLPSSIKSANPGIEISVLSGYEGLWNGVSGVDRVRHYRTHRELLDALRSETDVVVLADFEKPGLVPLMACEPGSSTYVELSLGAQCAAIVNRNWRRIWTVNMPLDGGFGYYEAFTRLCEWIGVTPAHSGRYCGTVRRSAKPSEGALRIFVSPFTSKYDPSPMYWSRILASLISPSPSRAVEFALDPGTSPATARFSAAVAGSAAARAVPGVSFSVAGDSRTLPLRGVWTELERAHAVVCSDSFVAHAAPQFGCTTLVVARAGLENWKTPWPRSFYFDLEQSLDQMLAAMRAILETCFPGTPDHARPGAILQLAASRLHDHSREFIAILGRAATSSARELLDARRRFLESHQALIETIPAWPPQLRGLIPNDGVDCSWRELDQDGADLQDREVIGHLQLEVRSWQQTNLCRFANLIAVRDPNSFGESA